MAKLQSPHLQATKHILWYLKCMKYYNILCKKGDLYEIKGFTTWDWPINEKKDMNDRIPIFQTW